MFLKLSAYAECSISVPLTVTCRLFFRAVLIDKYRLLAFGYALFLDDALPDIVLGRNIKHNLSHRLFDDGSEASCTGILLYSLVSDCSDGVFLELEVNVIHLEDLLILLDDSVLGFCKNSYESIGIESVESDRNRDTSDKLRDKTELHKVVRLYFVIVDTAVHVTA